MLTNIQAVTVICTTILFEVKSFLPQDRALVFVTQFKYGHALAAQLGCDFYRGSTDLKLTDKERETMVQRWRKGDTRIMVATDAFGPGNDYPSIRHIWFVGTPRGLVDMFQMAGRGGRDHGLAYVDFYPIQQDSYMHKPVDMHLGRQELEQLMKAPLKRCWREVAGRFLDGVPGIKCSNNSLDWRCPSCATNSLNPPPAWTRAQGSGNRYTAPPLPPAQLLPGQPLQSPQAGARRRRAPSTSIMLPPPSISAVIGTGQAFETPSHVAKKHKADHEELLRPVAERILQATNKLSGHCSLCRVKTGRLVPWHEPARVLSCEELKKLERAGQEEELVRGGNYLGWKKNIRYQGNQVCWQCHLPFLQDLAHQPKAGNTKVCNPQHDDMVLPVVYWAFMDGEMRGKLKGRFKQGWETDLEYAGWLTAKKKGWELSNVMEVFLWVVEEL